MHQTTEAQFNSVGMTSATVSELEKFVYDRFRELFKTIESNMGNKKKKVMFNVLGYLFNDKEITLQEIYEKIIDVKRDDVYNAIHCLSSNGLLDGDESNLCLSDLGKIVARRIVLSPEIDYIGSHTPKDTYKIMNSLEGHVKFEFYKVFELEFSDERYRNILADKKELVGKFKQDYSREFIEKLRETIRIPEGYEILTNFELEFKPDPIFTNINIKMPYDRTNLASEDNFTKAIGRVRDLGINYQFVEVKKVKEFDDDKFSIVIGDPVVEAYKHLAPIKIIADYEEFSKSLTKWFGSLPQSYKDKI